MERPNQGDAERGTIIDLAKDEEENGPAAPSEHPRDARQVEAT